MNSAKVPQVFVSTGASEFGTKYKEFPWTIGLAARLHLEGRLYGLHIKANQRGKRIAIIYQNDDYGKDYLYGFGRSPGRRTCVPTSSPRRRSRRPRRAPPRR